jgi:hypothetical protein
MQDATKPSATFFEIAVYDYIYIHVFIKYLRYKVCTDWSEVCNMSVHIRGQRFSARAGTFQRFKIYCKINIKRALYLFLVFTWRQRRHVGVP